MLPQRDFRLLMVCGNDLRRKTNVSSTLPKHELGSFEPYRVQLEKASVLPHQTETLAFVVSGV